MVQSMVNKPNALHELGYKIFLDRYAQKDVTRATLAVGDTVIVVVDAKTGQREIGTVTAINLPKVTVQLNDGQMVERDLENVDKPLETQPEQMMDRVAAGIAQIERSDELRQTWTKNFRWLLDDWKFVPGGRILTGAGTDQKLTYYNCYVIPSPKDSRSGIIKTLEQMTEIMSRGGGVGINISSLRPRHAYVKGVNGRSSGAVSWGALYSFVTGLIEQGGCFGPNERILTNDGLIPARELAERIEAGETFWAHTHRGPRRITARFRNGRKPLFEVVTRRGYRVAITEDHKVAVLMDGRVTTMPLKYLQVGDEILTLLGDGIDKPYVALASVTYKGSAMSTTLNENVTFPTALNEDLAYLLGYLYADGHVVMGRKVSWRAPKGFKLTTADAHPTIRERLIRIIERVFGVEPIVERGDGACADLAVYSRLIVEWLKVNGFLKPRAEDVAVPEAIFRSPSSVMGSFFAGYFDADGCNRGKKGGAGVDSVSLPMLQGLQTLLSINGIVSHISTQERAAQGWRAIHRLTVTGANFKARLAAFAPAEKLADTAHGVRDMYHTYPYAAYTALGARPKYRQRIHDGVSKRVSFGQLSAIRERLLAHGEASLADEVNVLQHVLPDTIARITPLAADETFDFEVEDVHLLSANGIYTSNSRRGALMLILNDWHPDVFNFINSKREAGNITNANISVGISDRFMEAVKADADWDLMFPDTSAPDYDETWDGDLEAWQAKGGKVIRYKTVKARELWNAIVESAWASAEPGVWFRDRSNKMSNSWYFSPLISTNPCVTGETRVYTNRGMRRIADLFVEGAGFDVVIDERFGAGVQFAPSSRVFMTGVKPVYRLQTKQGYSVRATADHRIMTTRGWVELQHLQPGDEVHILNRKGGFGGEGSLDEGRILGWLVGDGTIKSDHAVLSFFGSEKQKLAPLFSEAVNRLVAPMTTPRTYAVGVAAPRDRDEVRVQSERLRSYVKAYGLVGNEPQVPEVVFSGSEEMQRGFLQALFTADGSVQGTSEKGFSIRLASSTFELLSQVQMLLANFGIASLIYKDRQPDKLRLTPEGKGGKRLYHTRANHELLITRGDIATFAREIGFLTEAKQERLDEALAARPDGFYKQPFTATVTAIVPEGEEPVYDLIEEVTHSFVANGIVVHNCGEQPLSAWSVCNLGAINLAKFYDPVTNDVAWDTLDRTVRYAVRFLDNVIDSTPYFFEENERKQTSERRVGLGTMGVAELMLYCGVRYGSDESVAFIEKLYKAIAIAAYETSADLAAEKGAFEAFDAEKVLQSGFMQQMPEEVRERVRTKGLRNVTLLTQAPTGTTGTMVNTSTGIEPFFSWVYYRKSRLGLHEEQVPVVADWYAKNPGAEKLPDYFVTAMDLSPEEHVKVQGAFQRWIDSAISKTCNVPNHYTVEQVSQLYLQMYDLGCKGGTIYRDGSRDEQVLMLKGDERAEKEMETLRKEEKAAPEPVQTPHKEYPRPVRLSGTTVKFRTPFGTSYITMNNDEHGNPFEVFITVGKAGSDIQADAEAMGRMISLQLRTTAPHNRREMLRLIMEQLQGIGGARPTGIGSNRVLSLPDAVANAIAEYYFKDDAPQQLGLPMAGVEPTAPVQSRQTNGGYGSSANVTLSPREVVGFKSGADMCPECGTISLIRAEGCRRCTTCDYTEC